MVITPSQNCTRLLLSPITQPRCQLPYTALDLNSKQLTFDNGHNLFIFV
jgi:hypothetical protein